MNCLSGTFKFWDDLKNLLIIFVRFLDPDPQQLAEELKESASKRYKKLNKALAQLVSCHIINLSHQQVPSSQKKNTTM